MKKGFTMIELVFVIVILGILASIAVPKMVATRDDATAAKAVSEMKDSITQLAAYYTINGSFQARNGTTGYENQNILDGSDLAMTKQYSPTIAEVLTRANDKWTDCFSISLIRGGTIYLKPTVDASIPAASTNLCKTLKNVPTVQEWLDGENHSDGNIKIGGSGIYAPPAPPKATPKA